MLELKETIKMFFLYNRIDIKLVMIWWDDTTPYQRPPL
jgi:hypothetical protein